MKKILSIFLILILISSIFAQQKDYDNILSVEKTYIKSFGSDEDSEQFYSPICVKYNVHNRCVYIADFGNHAVYVLDENLNFKKKIGRKGQGPSEFNTPSYLTVLKNNKINVSHIIAEKNTANYVETTPPPNIEIPDWGWANEVVSYDEMYKEIITKAEQYLEEVRQINEKLAEGKTFTEFKNLLLKVKELNKK